MHKCRKNVTNDFTRSTDIIQVLNKLSTDKIHTNVPQNRQMSTTRNNRFRKISCVLHNQTSEESL